MNHVRVTASVITDNTGKTFNIPVLLLEHEGRCSVLEPLVDYLIANSGAKSVTWMIKLCQIVAMLLDYMDTNHSCFEKPVQLFAAFTERVFAGTIGEDGTDPSGLFWLPKRTVNAKQLLSEMSDFSDWMHREYGAAPLNPWREATSYEERLRWAANINKSQRSFLGHLDSVADATEAAKQARSTLQRRTPAGDFGETKAFPDDRFMELLFVGFMRPGKENSRDIVERYDWRGICITILLHWGGLRSCEPFHIWVCDVNANPVRPGEAIVRIYDPIDGAVPENFRGPNGKVFPNREACLALSYPGYRPRKKEKGNLHAGWKNPKMTDSERNYMQVHWLPSPLGGHFFLQAWLFYSRQRMRARIDARKHPFLFVSFRGAQRGEPYTIDAYQDAYVRAIRRIGLVPAKFNGTTLHGLRHAWGQRANRGKLGPLVIQKGLHQKSPESHAVYTQPSISKVTAALEAATAALAAGESLPMLPDLDAFLDAGRNDIKRHWPNDRSSNDA
jgi:hypothetical protein